MQLIGMLDSPSVRRVAIALHLMDLPFVHDPLSVFRHFGAFAAVNPVVKAPTLVTDDGMVLMDSTLILQHLDRLAAPSRALAPEDPTAYLHGLRVSGLALCACEKTVQIVYELQLRPLEKRYPPWLDRVGVQLREAYRLLEAEGPEGGGWSTGGRPVQADIDAAVAWAFTRSLLTELSPGNVPGAAEHRRLAAWAARAEALPAFRAAAI